MSLAPSYIRFSETLKDLRECQQHLDDCLSEDEHEARKKLIMLCIEIAAEWEDCDEQDLNPELDSLPHEDFDDEDEDDEDEDDEDGDDEDGDDEEEAGPEAGRVWSWFSKTARFIEQAGLYVIEVRGKRLSATDPRDLYEQAKRALTEN